MSNIVDHAKKELELLGEEPDTVEGYIAMLEIFAAMGHSGGSASEFIPTLNKLLEWENLTPLTDNPDEWERREIEGTDVVFQSHRNSKAFSEDGGKTYWLLPDSPTPGYRTYYNSVEYVEPEEDEGGLNYDAVPAFETAQEPAAEPVPEQGPEEPQHD